MRKIKLLLATALSLIAWTGTMAQTQHNADNYEAAKAAITDGGVYRIKTAVSGTNYYVTTNGTLTSDKDAAGYFTITQTSGGNYGTGFRIDTGTNRFTNPPLSNNVANLKPGNFANSTGDRADWERQILYKNSDGKYAIRSCNCADGTSSWNDAARTHWTYYINNDVVTPCYSYTAEYIWDFEGPLTTVNVTYKLVESDGTEVSSTTKKQEANSAIANPLPGTFTDFNGFPHEKFYYDYAVSGTIGDTDCTITITRTEKAGVVKALSDLSNTKAYNIGCDRGAMIAYDGKMVNTALNNAEVNAQPYGKFALLNYEGNYYIFSIDENKFVKNDASVALDLTTVGFSTEDAMVMTPQTAPYFLWHFNKEGKYLNTNGNAPLGYVINSYSTPDPGNLYYMVAVDDFDPTAALAELDAYFHPSYFVTYVVKDEAGNTIFTSEPQPTKLGAKITTLLDEFKRPFYTYNDVDVTISEQNTNVEFTATWDGPFKLSTDYANAQWQNMAMRGTWYVTSAIKDGDGAYKTQNANTMGLVEDSYQWAFIGNGYDGFKVINKAEGEGKSFAYGDVAGLNSGSIPTIMDDAEGNHVWKIVASTNTSVPANSFCLGVPGTDLYINQYGGEGGSLKFWNTTGNISDAGSAFTVFDVPSNFASYLVDEGIAAEYDATGYFAFTDAAKATLGWDPAYKTDCPFETYKTLKENLPAAKADLSNLVLPETGYYTLKNNARGGTYMGIDPSDANMYGNYAAANLPKHIVKLTKTGDATYTIGLMGKFAPATVTMSAQVTATAEAGTYTVSVPTVGYAVFSANPSEQYAALHCAGGGSIVGWEAAAAASQWIVEDATSIELAIGTEGYATAYLPFPVQYGGPLPVPEALGTWTFDDPSDLLAGTGIATLKATTHAKNNVTVTDLATAGITSVEGPDADNGAVNVPVGSSLLMAANNGAANIGTYSIMYDVCVEDGSTYVPLLQNSLTDGKDGSLFINKNQVGLGGGIGYHGSIENNKWYRIVFTVSPSEASIYVNGERLTTYNQNFNNVNGSYLKHWVLTTGALFFADEDGEEKAIKTSELRFWDIALNAEQVATLGSIGGDAPAFPEALGTWTFEDATDPYAGTGTATIAEWGNGVTFDGGVATVPVGAGIELSTNLTTTPTAYTLMQDVKFADVSGYISLFQNDVNNGKDGSIFVKDGKVGLNSAGLSYNGTINTDTWYRIVTVIDNGYCTLYVDGTQVGKSASADVNAWVMRDSRKLILFIDNDGEEKEVQLAEARFWDTALSATQVAQLATVGTTIDEGEAEAKDAVAYTATFDGSKTWLELSEVNGTIPTKTAVILKGAPKTYVYNIVAEAAPVENNVLMGTLEPIEPTGKYVLAKPAGEKVGFYKAEPDPEKGGKIPAGKAYLVSNDASIKAFYFAGDDATGIESVNSQNSLNTLNTQNSTIYNLAGQRISRMQKGINIVNGKKILK